MTVRAPGDVGSLVDHLFRHESGRMVSALTRVFGPHNLTLAEDVVQETLLQALQRWPFDGVPANPAGWLYKAARNKAIDIVRRRQTFERFEPELCALASAPSPAFDALVLDDQIEDDALRMMFTCCHPALPLESQVALTLRILCGFSAGEIARAFLTEDQTIQKRLYRAKQRLREARVPFEVPAGGELEPRLSAVRTVLYLMFNEGYSASFAEQPIRRDVCLEAMRLCKLLSEHDAGRAPATSALMAIMCFHAARFDARVDQDGHLLVLKHQDRSRWNRALIGEGFRYLEQSADGTELTEMHLEAGIAAAHCGADRYDQTDWASILRLYDRLMAMNPSPVVALNRAIAVAERHGPIAALEAIAAIPDRETLEGYYLLFATVGELYMQLGRPGEARGEFERALGLTSSRAEREFLQQKLEACPCP